MSPELYALIGVVAVALIGLAGIIVKGIFDRRIAEINDRANLTTTTIAEVTSLRTNDDAREKRLAEMREEIEKSQARNFDCERRCFALERRADDLERKIRDQTVLIARWQNHTGLEVPP